MTRNKVSYLRVPKPVSLWWNLLVDIVGAGNRMGAILQRVRRLLFRRRLPSMARRVSAHGSAALALAAAVLAACAQGNSDYERTILGIQQQIGAGELEEARTLIGAAEAKYPANGGLENLLGVVEIQEGHTEEARKEFAKAIQHDPKLMGAALNLSRLDMQEAATDADARARALKLSLRVLLADPHNDEANYNAATIFYWDRNSSASLDHLKKLSEEARGHAVAQALECAADAELGIRPAMLAVTAALAANPEITEQDAATCLPALRAARRADLIETLYAAANARQALSFEGLRTLGLAQEAEDRLPAARVSLESAYAADPTSVVVLADLARVAERAGDNEGALGYVAHARDLAPTDSKLAHEFAVICVRMGLLAEARKAFADALRLAPDNADYDLGMGLVISFSEDPSQGLPYLERYHALKPGDPEGALALGTTYFRMKDYENAGIWLKDAALVPKTAAEADYYLGSIARQQGRTDEAVADLNRSLTLDPARAATLAELGEIDLGTGKFAEAENHFNKALEIDAENYAATFGLLQLYARTGDPRREKQAARFEEIKNKRQERDTQMMRVIELKPVREADDANAHGKSTGTAP
jgi:tetratricopeptide (TPR) repeat protein